MKTISIAIDGPSGAGKNTLAKSVSKTLGYLYVDTGAIYRTIGYAAFSRAWTPRMVRPLPRCCRSWRSACITERTACST